LNTRSLLRWDFFIYGGSPPRLVARGVVIIFIRAN